VSHTPTTHLTTFISPRQNGEGLGHRVGEGVVFCGLGVRSRLVCVCVFQAWWSVRTVGFV
jgi:hypothetical protein